MKVIFLCGSLEPGKDGVGDYTRRLAGELKRKSYSVQLIALHDPFIKDIVEEKQNDAGISIQTFRLSSQLTIKHRTNDIDKIIQNFKPDWISLQFVLYAFHPKGLPFRWLTFFKQIKGTNKWHIMFHELWIGSKSHDSIKYKVVGSFQKLIIKKLIKTLCPVAVTTNLAYYQQLLLQLGFSASILPVFSNIPFGLPNNNPLANKIPTDIVGNRSKWLIAAMFGGQSGEISVQQNFLQLLQLVELTNKKLFLVHVGRMGLGAPFFSYIQDQHLCRVLLLGEQSAQSIASFIQLADFGISTYDAAFLEKSGSVAALLYNKLPVVLLKDSDITTTVSYPYARAVQHISNIVPFTQQSTEWNELFSLRNAAQFYEQTFNQQQ